VKIAVFSYHYWGSSSAEALVTRKTIDALLNLGHQVHVYTWRPKTGTEKGNLDFVLDSSTYRKSNRAMGIFRVLQLFPYSAFSWPPSQYMIKSIFHALGDHEKDPFDVIYSRSNKVLSHVAALAFHNKTKLPWVASFNDPYPPELYPPPYKIEQNLNYLENFSQNKLLKKLYNQPDALIFPSQRLFTHVDKALGFTEAREQHHYFFIPHIGAGRFGKSFNSENNEKFIFAHVGKLDEARYSEKFFMAWEEFKPDKKYMVEFRQIGHVDEAVRNKLIEANIVITPPVTYEESIKQMDSVDVLVLFEAPMEEGVFLPSKFADYISRKKPVLCLSPKDGVINDLISKHGGGIVADANRKDQILDAFYKLAEPKSRFEYVPSEDFLKNFSSTRIGKKIAGILEKAVRHEL